MCLDLGSEKGTALPSKQIYHGCYVELQITPYLCKRCQHSPTSPYHPFLLLSYGHGQLPVEMLGTRLGIESELDCTQDSESVGYGLHGNSHACGILQSPFSGVHHNNRLSSRALEAPSHWPDPEANINLFPQYVVPLKLPLFVPCSGSTIPTAPNYPEDYPNQPRSGAEQRAERCICES